jgi:hypothetical protein
MANLASLVLCLRVRIKPTQVEHLPKTPLQAMLLALPANIRLGLKGFLETNTLAY